MRISSAQKPLADPDAKALLYQAQHGDTAAREKLVEANLRLVASIACRFRNMGKDYDDIFQVGCLGLVKAINNFDLSFDVCFSTYAVPLIMGEIRRFLRDDTLLSVSRTLKEQAQLVKRGREELCRSLGGEPTIHQLAAHLHMTAEQITEAMEAMQPPNSIYDTAFQEDGDPVYLLDFLAGDDGDGICDRLLLEASLARLPAREKNIIELRYKSDKTQSEIGEMLHISQVQVSRLERAALLKLRSMIYK